MRLNDLPLDDPLGRLFDPNVLAEVSLSPDWVYTVIYDGYCAPCTRLVGRWIRWDKAGCLDVFPSQTPGLTQRFPQIPSHAYAESLQVIGRDDRVWQGAEGFARVLAVLPGGRAPGALLRLEILRPLAELVYRLLARNRYRLGCSTHCSPPRPAPDGR